LGRPLNEKVSTLIRSFSSGKHKQWAASGLFNFGQMDSHFSEFKNELGAPLVDHTEKKKDGED